MDATTLLNENRDEIVRIAASHGARNVRVFGSAGRGEAEASDIDLLVEMERVGASSITLPSGKTSRSCSAVRST